MDITTLLTTTVGDAVLPVFDGSWVGLPEAERNQVVENFTVLVKFVGKMRQAYDDALTIAQAKGELTNVEHIRKPREKSAEKVESMEDFLKKLK